MPNLSTITIAGHLGRDAELKDAKGNSLCEFSVAVSKKVRGEKSTAWYRCTLWGKRGEAVAQYLTKGSAVIVSGELIPREYKGKNDELRTSLDINVHELSFGGGGEKSDAPATSPSKSSYDDQDSIPF